MLKAKYKGKNNSVGFKTGQIYELKSQCIDNVIVIWTSDHKLSCPYSRIETFLENWILLQ